VKKDVKKPPKILSSPKNFNESPFLAHTVFPPEEKYALFTKNILRGPFPQKEGGGL